MQVQHQMLVSGINKAYIAALVGGNNVCLLEREADPEIHKSILNKAAKFWHSIETNTPPEPDFERDAEFVAMLYASAEDGEVAEPTDKIEELARNYKEAADAEKAAIVKKKATKAEILTLLGTAESCRGEEFSISAKERDPVQIEAYTKKGYRDFRINWRKKK